MNEATPNVIALSYAKRALLPGTREHERMRAYAAVLGSYHVIAFTRKKEGYPHFQKIGNLYLYATNATTKLGMLIAAYRLVKKIERTAPAQSFVISAQDPVVTGLLAWLLSSKQSKLQVQIHGDIFSPYFFAGDPFKITKQRLALFVLQRAKKIRVVSLRIARSLKERGINPAKITILPIQADLAQFLKIGSERVYSDHSPVRFLYLGRFSPEKNLSLILESFATLIKKGTVATLTLAGGGRDEGELRRQVAAGGLSEVVTFIPWTEEVPALMAAHDVLCLSSWHEGFAMVLLEAMASGLSVITTDVGCAGEVVLDGVHGLVVPVGDQAAYTAALEVLAIDGSLRSSYGMAGKQRAAQIAPTAETYLAAIKSSFSV